MAGLQAQLGRNSADVVLETCETFHMFTKHSGFEKLPLPNENSLHLKVPFHSIDKENIIYFGLTPSGIKYRVKPTIIPGAFFSECYLGNELSVQFPFFLVNNFPLLQENITPTCLKFSITDSTFSHHFLR